MWSTACLDTNKLLGGAFTKYATGGKTFLLVIIKNPLWAESATSTHEIIKALYKGHQITKCTNSTKG